MTNLDQQKPGGKSERRKQKRNKKAAQQQSPTTDQTQAAREAIMAATAPEETIESVATVERVAAVEAAPVEPVAPAEPAVTAEPVVERVASFRERMASVAPPSPPAQAKPAAPVETAPLQTAPLETAQAAPSPAAAPAAGIQAIANVYRDYTKKSLEDAQSLAEKLTAARSLDKAVEAQTEFARKACENFAADSRKLRELHRDLFWQAFRLPSWPGGRSQR